MDLLGSRTATSRPPASTPRAAASTATTTSGGRRGTARSTTASCASPDASPRCASRWPHDIALDGMPRERVLACAVRLLELGFFRIGGEAYAEENDTYGLATIRKRHVRVRGDLLEFDYDAKSGQHRLCQVADPEVRAVITTLRRRRAPTDAELLAYKDGREWVDVKSSDINEYVQEHIGDEFSAKDFRTWVGTVLAAVGPGHRGGRRVGDGAQAGRRLRGQGRRRAPRQHPRRGAQRLHRPAGRRALRAGRHRGGRARRRRHRGPRATASPRRSSRQSSTSSTGPVAATSGERRTGAAELAGAASLGPGLALLDVDVVGQAEHALGDDVALHLAGAAADGERGANRKP